MRVSLLFVLAGCWGGGVGVVPVPDDPPDTGDTIDVPRYTLTVIDAPDGLPYATPLGMGPGGLVVGYAGVEAWSPTARPLAVSAGTADTLDAPEDRAGFAWGADAQGVAVGEVAMQPVRWVDGVAEPLAVPDGWFSGSAHAAASGLVVGSWADYDDALPPNPVGPRPCAWPDPDGPAVPLAVPDGSLGAAWAVDPSGGIAGTVETVDGFRAAVWDDVDAQPEVVALPEGYFLAEARGIDAHGHVVGRASRSGGSSAFRVVGEGFDALDDLGSGYAEAYAIGDDHAIVGTANAGDGTVHAVLWWDGAPFDLNDRVDLPDTVSHLSTATGIGPGGVIAAEAVLATGESRVAVLTPLP